MCGIVGVLNLSAREPIDPDRLAHANNGMAHRGPDDSGVWAKGGIGLAARRLSIIDVPHGHQPMSNEDQSIYIVYNGEVYNHQDLRTELQSLGHRFQSTCDTEVIIHAYEKWGPEGCVGRLRGMFAFALWDTRSQTLMLARDRMGIKPLYTAEWNGRLYFASEIRPLLTCSDMVREVNLSVLGGFLAAGFVPSPHTMLKGVQKLPPAHFMLIQRGRSSLHRYWELSYDTVHGRSEAELIEQFRETLQECVRMRLMSEVPLGALLSGGIDSTTVVAMMQGMLSHPVKTVSVGFDVAALDEGALAVSSARLIGTEHHPITFTGDSMEEYPAALLAREEPLADATFVAVYKLFQACRQEGLTVVLTGEGADELLGGYHWHRNDARLHAFLRLPRAVRMLMASTPLDRVRGDAGMRTQRILRRSSATVAERYLDWMGSDPLGLGGGLLSTSVRAALATRETFDLLESWAAHVADVQAVAPSQQMLWLQSRTRMVDRINHNVDRMSMAHSIEARPIFLDHKLWEFCATVPPGVMFRGAKLRRTEKHLLREASKGIIPEDVRRRTKKGLWVPVAKWLYRERLPEWAETALSNTELKRAGLFDPDAVAQLRREHQRGAPGRATLLMSVLSVQIWRTLFVDSPPGGIKL